jgi:hypothetical protein
VSSTFGTNGFTGAGTLRPPRVIVRRSSSMWALQAALDRGGLGPVAGVDEAGRGACAGPLVVAACTDGFRVPGLTAPTCAVIGGDRAAACVAAASILAKVTRDRIMCAMHEELPSYGFDEHKGYCTVAHGRALDAHGPSPQHRFSFINVAAAAARHGVTPPRRVARPVSLAALVQNGLSAVPSAAVDGAASQDVTDAACEPAAV